MGAAYCKENSEVGRNRSRGKRWEQPTARRTVKWEEPIQREEPAYCKENSEVGRNRSRGKSQPTVRRTVKWGGTDPEGRGGSSLLQGEQ